MNDDGIFNGTQQQQKNRLSTFNTTANLHGTKKKSTTDILMPTHPFKNITYIKEHVFLFYKYENHKYDTTVSDDEILSFPVLIKSPINLFVNFCYYFVFLRKFSRK